MEKWITRKIDRYGAYGKSSRWKKLPEAGTSPVYHEPGRDVELAVGIVAPDHNRTVLFDRGAVHTTGSNDSHMIEISRNIALPKDVASPGDNRAIVFQREAVARTRGKRLLRQSINSPTAKEEGI